MSVVCEMRADGDFVAVLDRTELLAVNGSLNWIAQGCQSRVLRERFDQLVGLGRDDCLGLLHRVHDLLETDQRRVLELSEPEMTAIERCLRFTIDGPFSEDVQTVTGANEVPYRRLLDEVSRLASESR
jgi:hypothetical protein